MTASSPSLRVGGVTRTLWRLSAGLPSGRRLRRGILYRFAAAMCLGVPIGLLVKVIDDLRTDALTSERAWLYTAISVAAVAAQWVFGYLSNRDSWIAGLAVVGELRLRVLDHLRRLPMGFHTRRQTGDAATVFTQDMALIEEFTHEGLPAIAGAIGLPVAVTAVLLFVDAPMALALMASVAASAPLFAWTLRRFASLAATRQGMQAQANSRIIEYVQGIAVIRAFNQSGERQQRFRSSLDDVRQINTRLSVQIAPLNSIFLAVVHLGVPVVIASGAYWLFSGRLDVGVLIVFLVLVLRVYQPLIEVAEQSEILRIADASLQRVAAVLDVPEQPQPAASPPLEHFDVELDDVRFSYEPGVPVLSGVSLTAAERSMTAIIGPSGAGKTTVFNLIARFWDADEGTVRIGGRDVRELRTEQIFDAVGVVFQDVYLFNVSLFENIAFGRPDATPDAVVAAARAARCHDFISALPVGYDTVVSEGGQTLSGGERQRISIARAILKDAPIVLLDEATAALDATNEKLVAQAFAALVADKTVLVIAHRLPTIRAADQIVAIDGGRVVERGTHDELIAVGGLYARFWHERERAQGWRLTGDRLADAAPTDPPIQETA